MSFHTGEKKGGRNRTRIICIAVIAAFSLMGVGYASWTDGMNLKGVVSTGNIDPVFIVSAPVSEVNTVNAASTDKKEDVKAGDVKEAELPKPVVSALSYGKTMGINIDNAYEGFTTAIHFRIANLGTVPLNCTQVAALSVPDGVKVNVIPPSGAIYGANESTEGIIEIFVDKGSDKTEGTVSNDKIYNFTFALLFQQI